MKKNLWCLLLVVVMVGMILGGFSQPVLAQGKVYKFKMASAGPPSMATRKMMEKSIDLLKKRSNGRFEIDYYEPGVLFPEKQQLESVARGVVQISMSPSGPFWNNLGIVYAVRLLPLGYNAKEFGKHYRDKGGFYDFTAPYFEKNNLKLLTWAMQGATQAFFTKPVKTLEDLKGRVVAAPGGNGTKIAKAFGMTPMAVLGPDLLLAYQKGTIEGNIGSSENSMRGYGTVSFAKYEVVASFWEGNTPIACNLEWFNSLPSDLQQMVVDTYMELEKEHYANYDKLIKTDRDKVRAQGAIIYELPPAEMARWKAAIKPIYDEIAQKYPGEWEKFLEAAKKVLR